MTWFASVLAPVLRNEQQARLLAAVLLHPEREASIADLAREIGADAGNLHADVERLVGAGIFADRRVGRSRLVRSAPGPLTGPLTDLMLVTYRPKSVLEEALAGCVGIQQALIVGSWAARYAGQPGPPPRDVDLVIVGTPDRDHIDDLATTAADRLGRDVQVIHRTRRAWEAAADPFTQSVQQNPLVDLNLSG